MKNLCIGCLLASVLSASCVQQENGYTITGKIGGGLEDGMIVRLMDMENTPSEKGMEIARDTVQDGSFQLKGVVASPTLCRVEITRVSHYEDGKSYETETGTTLMLENVPVTMEAAHLDSIPLVWEFRSSPLQKEMNVTVNGGKAQREYNEYRKALHAWELQAWAMNMKVWQACFGQKEENPDSVAYYSRLCQQEELKVAEATDRFIQEHPTYAISVYLTQQKAKERFIYTVEELDGMLATVSAAYDTLRLRKLNETVAESKRYAKGLPYRDFTVLTEEKATKRLTDFLHSNTCTLIDFWASWCGPCRAAIPHVKELHQLYGDNLTVLSVSVDKNEAEWRKAVKQEQMPWAQLILPADKTLQKEVFDGYQFNGIPYLVIIDEKGKILCGTHSADEVSSILEKHITPNRHF